MTGRHERVQQQEGAFKRAVTDPLTGIYNRQYILDAIEKDVRRARRYGTPLSCLMLDLDGFKEMNDKYGHIEGDRILRRVAETIASTLRETDIAARYGGDEFCIVASATGLDGAMLLAERLRSAIATMDAVAGGRLLTITASVGVFSPATMSQFRPTALIDYAETALRKAKLNGNQVCAYSTSSVGVA